MFLPPQEWVCDSQRNSGQWAHQSHWQRIEYGQACGSSSSKGSSSCGPCLQLHMYRYHYQTFCSLLSYQAAHYQIQRLLVWILLIEWTSFFGSAFIERALFVARAFVCARPTCSTLPFCLEISIAIILVLSFFLVQPIIRVTGHFHITSNKVGVMAMFFGPFNALCSISNSLLFQLHPPFFSEECTWPPLVFSHYDVPVLQLHPQKLGASCVGTTLGASDN